MTCLSKFVRAVQAEIKKRGVIDPALASLYSDVHLNIWTLNVSQAMPELELQKDIVLP